MVIGIILAEGLLQGLLGSAIGILLGYLMALGVVKVAQGPLSQFINVQLGMPVISPGLVIVSILLGLGVTVFAGLLPAWNASRIAPIEALRPSLVEGEYKRQTGVGFIVGVVILVLTVAAIISGQAALIIPGGFFFLVGLVLITPALVRPFANLFGGIAALVTARQGIGDLAKSNLTRQPSRVAVTVSASMLALAIIVAAGGLVSSMLGLTFDMLKDSLGSDYLFVPPSVGLWGSNLGANPSLAEDLRQVEGVETVSTLRYAASSFDGKAISLLGIEPEAFQAVSGLVFSAGNESDYAEITAGRNMIVNSSFTIATGAQIGDTIELLTTDGKVPYRIAAVASDLLNAKITVAYISQDNMLADFGSNEDVFIQLNLKEGANRDVAGEQIKELAADYPQFKLIAGADYYAAMKAQGDVAFSAIYIVFAFLAFPSLIAMLNTLTINVLERTREIGMIRAVGGTRKQLRNMVLTEALMLAAIGTAFGILGGLYLGYVFVKGIEIMFPTGHHFPLSGILAATAIGLFVGALAAVIPARQAAKMDVIAALRYE
jgi:putative ABC transport system permease protein